jgi:hypothetical protein
MAEKFEQIANAILNALQGKESESERSELKEWIDLSDANLALIEEIVDDDKFESDFKEFNNSNSEECKRIMWQRINALENEKVSELLPRSGILKMPKWVAVAVFFAVIVAAVSYWYNSYNKQSVTVTDDNGNKNEMVNTVAGDEPTKILLNLADGTQRKIAQEQDNEIVSKEYGLYIENHTLKVKKASGSKKKSKLLYHTLIIPKGGQYQLTLSDGSKIWLNSETTINFPAIDTGGTRNATIIGEAYLEIKHDSSRPFIVHLPRATTVEVLGTTFNVNSYSNEPFIGTTLIDGEVKIKRSGETMALLPGQQARIFDNNIQIKDNIDIDRVLAWKEGEFDFTRDSLTSVVRQLARWYNMQVVYIDTPKILVRYSGKRSLTCDATLSGLKKGNYDIHIERSNDTLIVKE